MASKGKPGSALFLAVPTLDESDVSGARVDGSEEAMRRLRHPFAVGSPAARGRTESAGERPE
ncbi:hypothetical protein Vse01_55350 [Micromonospora sediminimaris]|uniref:Uncharacterized protein n=1 Tax=Micromonospora sediminimaris TaxID=547162 RepID=A0A9W5UWH0_9ACTN|nr:hypothetical protein Vse01_55350 [Micromonospora sediminimaris]